MKRTQEQEDKLFLEALDNKRVLKDATITIMGGTGKLKAYCQETDTFLQFPRHLRAFGLKYTADVIEVINESVTNKYFRVVKNTIRKYGSEKVIA
jgi:hypothetical protein